MIKVLISGYLGFNNSGDESILQAINNSIKEEKMPIEITALSSNPKKTAKNHKIKSLHSFNPFSILRGIIRSDIILSGGGNLLQDKTSSRSLWYYLLIILFGKIFGKKVMLYSNGVGPLSKKLNIKLVRWIINKVDIITLRETLSKEMLETIGVNRPPIYITSDPVFLLKPADKTKITKILSAENINIDNKKIGIAVRKWGNQRDLRVFATLCDEIIQNYKLDILFIPMQYPQDLITSQKIMQLMKKNASILQKTYSSNELIGVIGSMDIIISMRLHALIFAGIETVPMIGLVYDPKIKYYLNQANMPSIEYIKQIDINKIVNTIGSLLKNYNDKQVELAANIKKLKERAKQNNKYLYKLIEKGK
ncbi:MAG: polysaccharide pyruvyl transferase CsaB [Eubacteriales bacterium]